MKFFRPLFLFASILLCLPVILRAQATVNYYVSDTGSDANPGTPSQPFRTVQHCVGKFRDTVQVICNCQGTFNEEVLITAGGPSVQKRSAITAWDTDGDGSRQDETFIFDGQGTRNETIKSITGARPDNIEISWATFRNYDPDGGCNIDDDGELHFIKMVCWGNGGCADWWIHHNVFEKMGAACNVESHYIAIQPSDAPNLIVEHNRFDSIGGFIMRYVGGTGIKFRNNVVLVQGTGIKAWDDPDSIEITGNIFECDGNGINKPGDTRCSGQAAVSLSNNVTYSQVRDNTFIDCVTPINLATDSRFGTKNNGPHLIEGNRIYQSGKVCNRYAPAIEVSDNSDTTIYGDSIHVFDVTIRNNVIAWTDPTATSLGTAFSLNAGHPFPFVSNFRIYNNTIRSYGRGMLISLATKSGVRFPYQMNGLALRNNIFSNIRDEFMTLAGTTASWPDTGRELNFDADYNIYSGRDRITWAGIRYTLAGWRTARGQDAHSRISSPLFAAEADSSRPLYALAANDTAARNRGNSIPGVASDFFGRVRPMGGAWDIGAHEVKEKRIQYASETAGNDTNPGTADMPFRTLQHALDAWNGTDQFELRGAGRFSEELVLYRGGPAADSLNTILPWDTDGDGSTADETFLLDGGNTRRIALQTDSVLAPDYVRIAGVTFRDYAAAGCDSTVEVRFLRLKGNPADSVTGWRVEGNTFVGLGAGCAGNGKMAAIKGGLVRDLRIEENRFDSVGGGVLRAGSGKNILFARNDVRLAGTGVTAHGNVDSLTVADNVFVGDGNGGANSGATCRRQYAVELVNGARHGLVRGNVMAGTSGGVRFALNRNALRDNAHHIVERNAIYLNEDGCNTERPAILMVDCGDTALSGAAPHIEDILIRNNIMVFDGDAEQSGAAVKLTAGHPYPFRNNVRIYNNTIRGFDQGILARDKDDENGESYPYSLNGVDVRNNIFSAVADAHFKFRSGAWPDSLPSGWISDYNTFGTADRMRWEGKKTLAKWRTRTGQDMHSTLCEPDFTPGDTLYHLASIDLCASGRGIVLSEVFDDFDGDARPTTGATDIGADEMAAGTLGRVVAGNSRFGGASAMHDRNEAAALSALRIAPNPASEKTVLEFSLSRAAAVRLQVWNLNGSPVEGRLLTLEQGGHRLELGVAGLPEGVYLVRLAADGAEQTGRIVVVR